MHPEHPRVGGAIAWNAGCGFAVLLGLLLATPGATAATRTWTATTGPLLEHDDAVVGPVSDGRRLWTIELPPRRQALLRSRSVHTGKLLSSVRVDVPRLAGAVRTATEYDDLPDPQLVIGDHVGAITGTWCTPDPPAADPENARFAPTCVGHRTFYARFSPRTGRVADRRLTVAPRTLIAGRRPSELVRRPGRSSAVRDLVSRRTVLTVPRSARNVEGAGRFVGWKIGSARGQAFARMRVVDRDSGRERYSVRAERIAAAITPRKDEEAPGVDVDESTLAQNGAFDLSVYYRGRRFHPVYVDDRGRIRRLGGTIGDVTSYAVRTRGDRVLLSVDPGTVPPYVLCDGRSAWLSDRAGRVGTTFGAVPSSYRYGIQPPTFVTPTAVLWNDGSGYRVADHVQDLPLTRAGRASC
jgi:hypothetical protein